MLGYRRPNARLKPPATVLNRSGVLAWGGCDERDERAGQSGHWKMLLGNTDGMVVGSLSDNPEPTTIRGG